MPNSEMNRASSLDKRPDCFAEELSADDHHPSSVVAWWLEASMNLVCPGMLRMLVAASLMFRLVAEKSSSAGYLINSRPCAHSVLFSGDSVLSEVVQSSYSGKALSYHLASCGLRIKLSFVSRLHSLHLCSYHLPVGS